MKTDGVCVSLSFGPLSISCAVDIPRALRYLGHRHHEVPDHLEERLRAVAQRCEEASRPRAVVRTFPLRMVGQGALSFPIVLEGANLELPGKDIARFLEGCSHVALLVVTLGMENERELLRAQALGSVEELLMDGCSSSMAEEAARATSKEIAWRAHAEGFEATRRFSPGYGDLPLTLQPEILRLTGADKLLGLQASPSCLLTPMKSVTAIVGLWPIDLERR